MNNRLLALLPLPAAPGRRVRCSICGTAVPAGEARHDGFGLVCEICAGTVPVYNVPVPAWFWEIEPPF